MARAAPPFRFGHAAEADWETATATCLAAMAPLPANANVGFVYVTDRLAEALDLILEALVAETGIAAWTGTVGIGVCASGIEYFDRPALVTMAGHLPEGRFALFDAAHQDLAGFVDRHRGWLDLSPGNFGVVHADPRDPRILQLVPALGEAAAAFLVGALTSSRGSHAQVAGALSEGAVSGLIVSGQVGVATGLTQGCSPIGPPHLVTEADGNVIVSLDDRPVLEVFAEEIGEVLARDLSRVGGYIFAAVPVRGTDWGDYMVRNLAGIDRQQGLLAIAEELEVGQQLMFCRRDHAAAAQDLGRMLEQLKARLERPPKGALYHTCLARGPNLFGAESQELKAIQAALGELPLVGFFGNGEISNNRLYTYTGVLSVFT